MNQLTRRAGWIVGAVSLLGAVALAQNVGRPPYNPYTGQPLPPPAAGCNPLTGRVQPPPAARAGSWPGATPPVSGKAGPGLESLDQAVLGVMERHGIPGAALAIAKDGRLVYGKGCGWADLAAGVPAGPRPFSA